MGMYIFCFFLFNTRFKDGFITDDRKTRSLLHQFSIDTAIEDEELQYTEDNIKKHFPSALKFFLNVKGQRMYKQLSEEIPIPDKVVEQPFACMCTTTIYRGK